MDTKKIKIPAFLWLAFTVFAAYCRTLTVDSNQKLACEINPKLWLLDECGTNGYRKKAGNCLISQSISKPILSDESVAIFYLGKPDTIFINTDMSKRYFYVIDGSPTCMSYFPDGVLESLSLYVDQNKKIISITGGIH
ncbi:MAG: hypothetical protein IT269_14700 [Saprospiraceae bacterium]|nr:hypothetical protein [Saprospiraceae bacterium]